MNHYSQALEALKSQPDHELKQVGDQWQTPKPIALGLFHTFAPKIGPVVIDVFADDCNHLVPHYYTAAENALLQDLAGDCRRLGGAAYGNPPYSIPKQDDNGNPLTGMENILNWCREQRDAGAKIMLLIKAATSDGWWPEDADFIQFISGRIAFEVPAWYKPRDPKKDKPTASGFASAVMIWDKEWKWERRPIERLNRDNLITTGNILLAMIEQRASELAQQYASATLEHRPDDAEPGEEIGPCCPGCGQNCDHVELAGYRTFCQPCYDKLPPFPKDGRGYNPEQQADGSWLWVTNEPEPQQTHNWPVEVKEIVELALDQCSEVPTDAFYNQLCNEANRQLLTNGFDKESIVADLVNNMLKDNEICAA